MILLKRILIPIAKQTNNNISIDTCYLKSPINNSGNSNIICYKKESKIIQQKMKKIFL